MKAVLTLPTGDTVEATVYLQEAGHRGGLQLWRGSVEGVSNTDLVTIANHRDPVTRIRLSDGRTGEIWFGTPDFQRGTIDFTVNGVFADPEE